MRKIFLMILTVFLMTGCSSSNGEKIVIGLDDEFPPLGFRDESGELVGFDVDLAKEAAKRMDVTIIFKPIDWDKKREELNSGNVDLIWNGLDVTEERKEYMIFTRPYADDRQIFLVKHGRENDIHSEGDLEDKFVGVQAGATSEDYVNTNERLKNTFAGCKVYGKLRSALADLQNGEIDVFICDEMVARYETMKNPDRYDVIDVKTGHATEMAVGFRKDNEELRDRVQKVFDEMVKDGTAKKISEKWFNANLIKYTRI